MRLRRVLVRKEQRLIKIHRRHPKGRLSRRQRRKHLLLFLLRRRNNNRCFLLYLLDNLPFGWRRCIFINLYSFLTRTLLNLIITLFNLCCTPKFALSFHKGSPWIPSLLLSSFQALNYKFSKKITHKGKMVICTLKSQTLTFGSKSSFKDHISSRRVEI